MANKYKILIVEDESSILSFIKATLEANEYQAITADTCKNGLMMYASHRPDLVILDLGLPDMDGTEFIKEVRRDSVTPILVLSARTEENDKVSALDLGANDYITKPFGTAELLARVRAALRSKRNSESSGTTGGEFTLNDMIINYDKRSVFVGNQEIKLTQTEYNILALLSFHSGKVLTYAFIINQIWGYVDSTSTKKLQVNMSNLRKKLGSKPGENKYIINELGVGYRMQDEF